MSIDLDLQKDLHEAFRLLYDDEEGFDFDADSDEDGDATQLPGEEGTRLEPEIRSTKYSKKRLQAMLDALIPSDPTIPPAQKRRRLLPVSLDPTTPATSARQTEGLPFSPNSTTSYRSRLLTFTLPTYSSKPHSLRPQNVTRYGWKNSGRERLYCEQCGSGWIIKGLNDPSLAKARKRLVELYEEQLVKAHKHGCPWRIQQSPASIHYQLLALNPPLTSRLAPIAREIDTDYLKAETNGPITPVRVTGGLPSGELQNLLESLQTVSSAEPSPEASSGGITPEAANLSFFGWRPYRPAASSSRPVPAPATGAVPDVLHCAICDRKVGLYNFRQDVPVDQGGSLIGAKKGKNRALDVVGEHREFCPIRVYADTVSENGDDEEDHSKEEGLGIERPWWRSAVVLREPNSFSSAGLSADPGLEKKGLTGRMTKQEVLGRLKEILGEKDTRLNLRGRL